jgi:hypothetical protein
VKKRHSSDGRQTEKVIGIVETAIRPLGSLTQTSSNDSPALFPHFAKQIHERTPERVDITILIFSDIQGTHQISWILLRGNDNLKIKE